MCFVCPVRAECDDYRVRTDSQYGMWAGKIHNKDDATKDKEQKHG